MATSTIKLYKNCKLEDLNNAVVQNVNLYLGTLDSVLFENYQFIKGLISDTKITVKVVLSQAQVELNVDRSYYNYFNYASITNSTGDFTYYYFIDKLEWRSANCYELHLTLDVLNTFQPNSEIDFRSNTFIERQHKDRFDVDGTDFGYRELRNTESLFDNLDYILGPIFTGDDGTFFIQQSGYSPAPVLFISKVVRNTGEVLNSWSGTYLHEEYDSGDLAHSWFNLFNGVNLVKSFNKVDINNDFNNGIIYRISHNYSQSRIQLNNTWNHYIHLVNIRLLRSIDHVSENLTPTLYKNENDDTYFADQNDLDNIKWYLAYYTDNSSPDANTGVRCSVIPGRSMNVKNIITYNRLTASHLTPGRTYAICQLVMPGHEHDGWIDVYNTSGGAYDKMGYLDVEYNNWDQPYYVHYMLVKRSGDSTSTTFTVEFWKSPGYSTTFSQADLISRYTGLTSIQLDGISIDTIKPYFKTSISRHDWDSWTDEPTQDIELGISRPESVSINGFYDASLADERMIKVIELPYCPLAHKYIDSFNIEVYGSYLTVFDNHVPAANPANTFKAIELPIQWGQYGYRLESEIIDANFKPLNNLYHDIDNVAVNSLRDDVLESKVYSSEFYRPTFNYDSFNFTFELENAEATDFDKPMTVWFEATKSANSAFMFTFADYTLKRTTNNFGNVLYVNRNNEIPIYNNEYLNYLKNGYNYDVKAKNQNLIQSIANIGINTAKGAATGMITGNVAGVAVGAVAGLAKGITNTIFGQIEAEDAINRKKTELANSKASIASADCVDLLFGYCRNAATYCEFKASDEVNKLVSDLFYYCGYKHGYKAMPNINSRYWFNYLQGDIVFDGHVNMSADIKQALVDKYKEGVTIFHNRIVDGQRVWDLDQEKENWEISIINAQN